MNREDLMRRLPEKTAPILSQGFHILSPTASWHNYKMRERAREQTAEFFGEETWDRLESEFYEESGIMDVVMAALEEVEDEKVVFDAHQGVCARLYAIIRENEPETVVATGTYSGVATTSMLLGLDENDRGTLYSVDASKELHGADGAGSSRRDSLEEFYERGRPSCAEHRSHELPPDKDPGWVVPEELRDRWVLETGQSRAVLPGLVGEIPEIDLFYHDSELSTSRMLFEFELAWEHLSDGGILLSPHIDRNDAFDIFVDERDGEHGVLYFDYLYTSEYDEPCSCGYVIK